MRRHLGFVPLLALVLASCQDAASPTAPTTPFASASLAGAPEDYIVVLHASEANVPATARNLATLERGTVKAQWEHALKGFVVELTPAAAADLARQPQVVSVEKDGPIYALATQSPVGSWGQDRVDQRSLPLDNSFTYANSGAGVHVYIIDTGLNATHAEFTGRVGNGVNFAGGTSTNDCNGHGTHVAGTVGGTTYGLAKGVTIHPVRVLDCAGSGQWSWFISGINWIIANKITPAVANASLGGGINAGADQATNNLAAAGVTFSVASGNSNANACNFSPARNGTTNGVISVNASAINDARASFSNFGSCTDIYGPGVNIKSAWIGSTTATNTISGTSMATPHATGTAALYLGNNSALTPAQVEAAMKADATPNKITGNPTGTPNSLLYVGNIGGGGGNQAPVADFTISCNAAAHSCTLDAGASTDDGGIGNLTFAWSAPGRPARAQKVITRVNLTCESGACAPQTYNETLKVRDSGGLTSTITKSVTIP